MQIKNKKNPLDRTNLETYTTSQLLELADEYGIDIPEELNRRFIIGELLEVAKELDEDKKETIVITDSVVENAELPEGYNETMIDVILRNPISLYVYWDFSDIKLRELSENQTPVELKVCFFEDAESEQSTDTFNIQIDLESKNQYIIIPGGKKYVRVDLLCASENERDSVLAVSRRVAIPQGNETLLNARPGMDLKMNEIMKLSGTQELLKDHFNSHRQSFY